MNCSVGVKQSDRGSNYNQLEFRQRTTQFWMMDRSILCLNVGYRHICITVEDSFVQSMLHLLTTRYIYINILKNFILEIKKAINRNQIIDTVALTPRRSVQTS